jgi:hypothetical protein
MKSQPPKLIYICNPVPLLFRSRGDNQIMIKLQKYSINNILLTNKILSVYINKFWDDIFSSIKGENHLWLMCKVNFSESELGYRTLGHLRRVNFTDKDLFINYLSDRLEIINDSYTTLAISQITFSYIINEGLATDKDRLLLENIEDKSLTRHIFNNYRLPISMNPSDYGLVRSSSTFDSFIRFIVKNGSRIYEIDSSLDGLTNKVTILGASDLTWTDTVLTLGFKREIGKSTIYFLDGITNNVSIIDASDLKRALPDSNWDLLN